MGLADINEQKIRLAFVILVKLLQLARLATEGRSSVAGEDEHHRTARRQAGKRHFALAGHQR
jgi:hypothetical protein